MKITTCQQARNLIAEINKSVLRHQTNINRVILPIGIYRQVLQQLMLESKERELIKLGFCQFEFCKAYFSWSIFPWIKVVATNQMVFNVSVKPVNGDFTTEAHQSRFSKLFYGIV